jgi:hypothetical protein
VLPAGVSGNWTGSGFALQSESNTSPIGFLQGTLERARIASDGKVGIGVTAPTAAGGILQLAGGITFPATPVASTDPNTLDDYEEGVFTPAIAGATTAGTGTYVRQVACYTKIGKRVCVEGIVEWSAHTGAGFLRVTNLPFASLNTANYFAAGALFCNNITSPANTITRIHSNPGQSYLTVVGEPIAGGTSQSIGVDAAGYIMFAISYMTA